MWRDSQSIVVKKIKIFQGHIFLSGPNFFGNLLEEIRSKCFYAQERTKKITGIKMTMFPKIYGLENSKIYQKSLARNLQKLTARLRGRHTFGPLVFSNYEKMAVIFQSTKKGGLKLKKKITSQKLILVKSRYFYQF